jgi:hypothetical protein
MKKIYILASASMFVSAVSAQKISVDQKPVHASEISAKSTETINKKAPGDVFWYEDFANGVAGNSVDGDNNPIGGAWTRGFTGSTDYSAVWNFNQNPRGQYESNLPFLSESASNGWMIFDANYQTDQDNPGGFITIDGYLESPAIDITSMGTNALVLEVQQTYRTCCSGAAYPVGIFVGYYDNGSASWVWTKKNSGNAAHNTYPASRTSSGYNAERREINIACEASLAAANTGEIKVRFHWNSELNGSNSYYMWMIDDVRIKEAGGFDANLYKMYSGDIFSDFEYYAIPDGQIINYPLVVDGRISNQGGGDLTGVQLDVTVTNDVTSSVVHTSSSPQQNITVCDGEGAILYNTGFIPTDDAVYTVQLAVSTNEADEVSGNNMRSKKFEKTAYEFGHYNPSSPDVGIDVVNDGSNPGRVMSAYAIYEDATIYGFYVYFLNGTTAASTNTVDQIAKISIRDAADAVSIIREQEFILCSNCINKVMPIRFENPLNVFAGDFFYASLDAFGGGDVLVVAADYDGDDDNSTLLDINGTIFGASQDPYVNLSFDPNIETLLSLNDIKNTNGLSLMQNIPNPATFSTEIRYALGNTANVTLEVVDVTGKVIATHALGMRAAGDHSFELNTSDFADGIYYYTLTAGSDRLSNKMVVRK